MTDWSHPPVRVGLVGAGPWAARTHAPMLAAGPETLLSGVWARRAEAASAVAGPLGVRTHRSFPELLQDCEAVAFAVPPAVQADLAPKAALAGRSLLLEKPIADDVEGARRVAAAVSSAGVASLVCLTKRFHHRTRGFLDAARQLRAASPVTGVVGTYLHGAFLAGDFATAWRLDNGLLLDLGPHLLDLVETAAGPVTELAAAGSMADVVALTTRHDPGGVGQLVLSGAVKVPVAQTTVDLLSRQGPLHFDSADMDHSECWPRIRREFALAVRTGSPVVADARRGLWLQEVIAAATQALASGRWVTVEHRDP